MDIDFRSAAAKRDAYSIAFAVESKLAGLWSDIPYYCGDTTNPMFKTDMTNAITALGILDSNNAPPLDQRYGAISPGSKTSALLNPSFAQYNTAGAVMTDTITKGTLGERFGINWGLSQAIVNRASSASGGATAWGTPLVNTTTAAIGDVTLAVDGLAASGAIKKGDAFQVGGHYYVVTANVTASSNAATLAISPALKVPTHPMTARRMRVTIVRLPVWIGSP